MKLHLSRFHKITFKWEKMYFSFPVYILSMPLSALDSYFLIYFFSSVFSFYIFWIHTQFPFILTIYIFSSFPLFYAYVSINLSAHLLISTSPSSYHTHTHTHTHLQQFIAIKHKSKMKLIIQYLHVSLCQAARTLP